MNSNSRPKQAGHVLATDLDGTLIPLDESAENRRDLVQLGELIREQNVKLVYVTGRHLESVQRAQAEYPLPRPDWIICDVGSTIYQLDDDGEPTPSAEYAKHLQKIIDGFPLDALIAAFHDLKEMRLQEEEKQGHFKLSYYAHAEGLDPLVAELQRRLQASQAPYSLICSVDPFNGDGLIDFLPKGVSKAHALAWWTDQKDDSRRLVIFAGDSGNDTAALTAGYRAIVVGNADRNVARTVSTYHRENGWKNRLYLAQAPATSGLLAGCRWFELFSETETVDFPPRTMPWGATPVTAGQTHFRVWAPNRQSVGVEIHRGAETEIHPLARQEDGCFAGVIRGARPGDDYRYRLDRELLRPDPVSRFQPRGVHGPSQIIDPNAFAWTDQNWPGVFKRDLVIYEMHVGTFTEKETFQAAIERLSELKELGITAVEILPVAQTPGRWNWGYDGVNLFAPRNTYGKPEDFKAFVDACHAEGLAVILDVVYNHVGPEGNYWGDFAPYYSEKHHTPWGEAFAFDGPEAKTVRRFVIENALYWLREFHLDGLRLDAVHCMTDDSKPHILEDIRKAVAEFRQSVKRTIHLIAEANIYDPEILPPDPDSPGYDAAWCDDIMHSIYALITPGMNITHRSYSGPEDLAEALKYGFLYQGMPETRMDEDRRKQRSSDPEGRFRQDFIIAVQTHDIVGNHPHGLRVHQLTSPAHQKAAAALVLLYPAIPLIFMGEEVAASSPFRFFVDFEDVGIQKAVDDGRAAEYPHQEWEGAISPSVKDAFHESILAGSDDPSLSEWYRSLLRVRRDWQEAEILLPEGFQSFWDPEAKLFGFRFVRPDGQDAFVLSRLFAVNESPQPVTVQIAGEVLLDSAGEDLSRANPVIELTQPRGLIGRGTFQIRRDS